MNFSREPPKLVWAERKAEIERRSRSKRSAPSCKSKKREGCQGLA
jgi:hypothetical protein